MTGPMSMVLPSRISLRPLWLSEIGSMQCVQLQDTKDFIIPSAYVRSL